VGDREIALRLGERDESRIDALAILTEREGQTTINIVARDASADEVVVVDEGTCDAAATVPAFLLGDFDATGRSVTTIDAPLADLSGSAHSIAIRRSAENYGDVVACGDIPADE
jgi:hypothetical protein